MYNAHFGLRRAPFGITPDPALFYAGGGRGEILDALVYAVTSGQGIVKVVGEVGTGKTMLCRMLESRLGERVEVAYLTNPGLGPEEMLRAIALELKLPLGEEASRLQVWNALQAHLLARHADGRRVVALVEEAQAIPIETLEEIRLLSNLETAREKLLHIVLFGQPELDAKLSREEIRQMRDRITHSFQLPPFTAAQVRDYMVFRLRQVGYRGEDMFRRGAYQGIVAASAGLTRRINILADKALLAAFAEDAHGVTRRHVQKAIADSELPAPHRSHAGRWWAVAGVLMVIALAAGGWFAVRHGLGWLPGAAPPAREAQASPAPSDGNGARTPAAAGGAAAPAPPGARSAQAASSAPPATTAPAAAAPAPTGGAVPAAGTTHRASAQEASLSTGEGTASGAGAAKTATAVAPASPPGAAQSDAAPAAKPPAPAAGSVLASRPRTPQPGATSAGAGPDAAKVRAVAATPPAESLQVAAPLLAARLAATRRWRTEVAASRYCIQLLMADVDKEAKLESVLKRFSALGDAARLYVYRTRAAGRDWYAVIYADYPTRAAAEAAMHALPPAMTRFGPYVRQVGALSGGAGTG